MKLNGFKKSVYGSVRPTVVCFHPIMFNFIHNLQIIWGIIQPVVINVMNDLVLSKVATNFMFCNKVSKFNVSLFVRAMMSVTLYEGVTLTGYARHHWF